MKIPLLLLFISLTLTGCNSELDLFNEKAEGYAKSDNSIDQKEFEDLVTDIKINASNRDFKRFYSDGKPDNSKIRIYLEKLGAIVALDTEEKHTKNYVNVYIENSGSMNGYINGNTEFKAAIQDLLVLLKYEYDEENIKLYFINSGIYPTNIDTDLAGFAGALNAKSFRVGETASSNLNNVFKQVLDKTSKDTLSILVSDCIYSIKGGKTEDLLSDQKSLTKDAFLTKSKEKLNLTTTITKLSSQFNGNYWDKNDKATLLNNTQRPYYIITMGGKRAMNHFNAKIPFSKDKVAGYQDTYIMSFVDAKLNYYSVIATTTDAGSYKANREYIQDNAIKGIEDISADSRNDNEFTFSIAVDMAKIPVTESYVTNKSNYTITNGNYTITGIYPYDKTKVKPQSVNMIGKANATPTHYIVFKANTTNYSDLSFALKKQIPQWVFTTHTQDDTNVTANTNKTFGFKYLVEGISEAYQTVSPSQNYYNLTIKINP